MPSEIDIHKAIAQWLDLLGVRYFHPANGGYRRKAEAGILAGMGVKSGVPDLIIVDPPPAEPNRVGCVVEVKTPLGRVSKAQRDWLCAFSERGWVSIVARSFREAERELTRLGYNRARCGRD